MKRHDHNGLKIAGVAITALFFLSVFSLPALAADVTGIEQPAGESSTFQAVEANLDIPIPYVDFSSAVKNGKYITVPFLAQYISGVYRFLISIVGVVAGAFILVGGFQYLTAGGAKERVAGAKKRIMNALIGLVLAFSSYIILYAINPDLLEFNDLNLLNIDQETFDLSETGVNDTGKEVLPNISAMVSGCGSTSYDDLFKHYASCVKRGDKVIDWRILKAIACAESGLNTKNHTKRDCTDARNCFVGLFQLYREYCVDRLKDIRSRGLSYLQKYLSSRDDCTIEARENPEINTALFTLKLNSNLNRILSSCGDSINLQNYVLITYVAHNNGPAVMGYVISHGGCSFQGQGNTYTSCIMGHGQNEGLRDAVRNFYETKGTTNALNRAKGGKVVICTKDFGMKSDGTRFQTTMEENEKWYGSCISADYGEIKMCYGFDMVNQVLATGAKTVLVNPDPAFACPFDTGKGVML